MASSGNRKLISIQAAWHQWPTWYSMQILRAVFSAKVALFSVFSPNTRFARWGVVQPVGHLTVNEDGEGSNPSAPAKFPS
jgi:hypothetical protein